MKVTMISIAIAALGTVTKGLVRGQEDLEIRGQVVIIQTTVLLRSDRILRRVLETWRDLRRLAVTQTPLENHQLTLKWNWWPEFKSWTRVFVFNFVLIPSVLPGFHLWVNNWTDWLLNLLLANQSRRRKMNSNQIWLTLADAKTISQRWCEKLS